MSKLLRFLFVISASLWLAGCASAPGHRLLDKTDPDHNAAIEIQSAFNDWNDATRRGDLASLMEKFDQGDNIILVGSDKAEVFRGRTQIEAWLKKLFKNNRFSWSVKQMQIDAYEPGSAWIFMDGAMHITDLNGKIKGETPYRISGVLVRRGNQWKWRLWNGSVPAGE